MEKVFKSAFVATLMCLVLGFSILSWWGFFLGTLLGEVIIVPFIKSFWKSFKEGWKLQTKTTNSLYTLDVDIKGDGNHWVVNLKENGVPEGPYTFISWDDAYNFVSDRSRNR